MITVEAAVATVEQGAKVDSETAMHLQHRATSVTWKASPTRPNTTPLHSTLSMPQMSRHAPLCAWLRLAATATSSIPAFRTALTSCNRYRRASSLLRPAQTSSSGIAHALQPHQQKSDSHIRPPSSPPISTRHARGLILSY